MTFTLFTFKKTVSITPRNPRCLKVLRRGWDTIQNVIQHVPAYLLMRIILNDLVYRFYFCKWYWADFLTKPHLTTSDIFSTVILDSNDLADSILHFLILIFSWLSENTTSYHLFKQFYYVLDFQIFRSRAALWRY